MLASDQCSASSPPRSTSANAATANANRKSADAFANDARRAADHRERGLGRLLAVRRLVADPHAAERRVRLLALRGQLDLVERGDLVAGADLAGVDLVVAEVVVLDVAVLVADEAVARDHRRVEVDLQLDVLRDDLEVRGRAAPGTPSSPASIESM